MPRLRSIARTDTKRRLAIRTRTTYRQSHGCLRSAHRQAEECHPRRPCFRTTTNTADAFVIGAAFVPHRR
jgi:hypothetical protein